jgi:hypothetical protein
VSGITWFWPGVAVVLAVGWVVVPPIAGALRIDRRLAWLLVIGVGLILVGEATPIRAPVGIDLAAQRSCDLGRRSIAALSEITALRDVTFNIALFVPAGVAIALLPMRRRSIVPLAGVAALPAAVEAFQFVVPMLARGCQSADAIDGLMGLAMGAGAGLVARLAHRALVGEGRSEPG